MKKLAILFVTAIILTVCGCAIPKPDMEPATIVADDTPQVTLQL